MNWHAARADGEETGMSRSRSERRPGAATGAGETGVLVCATACTTPLPTSPLYPRPPPPPPPAAPTSPRVNREDGQRHTLKLLNHNGAALGTTTTTETVSGLTLEAVTQPSDQGSRGDGAMGGGGGGVRGGGGTLSVAQ